jgi:hypothetical protein
MAIAGSVMGRGGAPPSAARRFSRNDQRWSSTPARHRRRPRVPERPQKLSRQPTSGRAPPSPSPRSPAVPPSGERLFEELDRFLDPAGALAWFANAAAVLMKREVVFMGKDEPPFGHRRAAPDPHHGELRFQGVPQTFDADRTSGADVEPPRDAAGVLTALGRFNDPVQLAITTSRFVCPGHGFRHRLEEIHGLTVAKLSRIKAMLDESGRS